VADEGALAPAHHLLADTHGTRQIADGVVVVDESIEDFRPGGLGALLAVVIVDVLEQSVLVLEFEVVPVLATHEHTGIAIAQLKVVDALEDLREGLALLEVQPAVVTGLRLALAAVVGADQVTIRAAHRPAGTDRQRAVELPLDLTDIEI